MNVDWYDVVVPLFILILLEPMKCTQLPITDQCHLGKFLTFTNSCIAVSSNIFVLHFVVLSTLQFLVEKA